MYYVGSHGYSWTSTYIDDGAYGLDFHYNAISFQYHHLGRAYGFQLRCLQE
ncbi:MAG: hypothetical protein K2G93_04475 [Rikenella sp.]|nr:hypothetical protein [Rikenella sp.]